MEATRDGGSCTFPSSKDAHSPAPLSAEQVYNDYATRVYNVARKMVRTPADAEDVTQDVLLQLVRKLPSVRGESALPTWLHRVIVNAALAHRKRRWARGASSQNLGTRCWKGRSPKRLAAGGCADRKLR